MTARRAAFAAVTLLAALILPAPAAEADPGTLRLVVGGDAGFSGDGGPATGARLNNPTGAAVGPDGTLYIADTMNHRVRALAPDGTIRTVAGNGQSRPPSLPLAPGTTGTAVALGLPTDVAVGPDNTVYIADSAAIRVYALASDGTIALRADASNARGLYDIRGIAVGASGTLYISDRRNNRVFACTADGMVTVAVGSGRPAPLPGDLAVDDRGALWITGTVHLYRMDTETVTAVTVESGRWAPYAGREWPLVAPTMTNVSAVTVGGDDVYIVEGTTRAVHRLSSDGVVSTVADLPPGEFPRSDPVQLAAGGWGPLFVVDMVSSQIFALDSAATGPMKEPGRRAIPWWWVLGAGALVLMLIVIGETARRRRRRPTRST